MTLAEGRVQALPVGAGDRTPPKSRAGKNQSRWRSPTRCVRPPRPDVPTVKEAGYPDHHARRPGRLLRAAGNVECASRRRIAADIGAVVAADPMIEARLTATRADPSTSAGLRGSPAAIEEQRAQIAGDLPRRLGNQANAVIAWRA